jgi:hypothetical protein
MTQGDDVLECDCGGAIEKGAEEVQIPSTRIIAAPSGEG